MSEGDKKKTKKNSAEEILKFIKTIIDYNRQIQKAIVLASKIKKTESESKPEESIAESVKSRRQNSEEK